MNKPLLLSDRAEIQNQVCLSCGSKGVSPSRGMVLYQQIVSESLKPELTGDEAALTCRGLILLRKSGSGGEVWQIS